MDATCHKNVQSWKQQSIPKGCGVDIHNIIGKLPKPRLGWALLKQCY